MNSLEKKMVETLVDLRENHHVSGIKAEFEEEGTRTEEALLLKELVTLAGLDFTIKIGGCGALKDMYEAKAIGVNSIVAPMIESPYALKKYIETAKIAFSEEEREKISFFINIETITGYNCIDEILEIPEAKALEGIVLGRSDMTGSLGLSKEEIESNRIFEMASNLALKMAKHGKKLIVGGGVSPHSIPFFEKLPKESLSKFETRKVIFDAKAALENTNAEKGIIKAVGFELMWLKNKRDFYKTIYNEDIQRLATLEARYKDWIEEACGLCV